MNDRELSFPGENKIESEMLALKKGKTWKDLPSKVKN